VDATRNLAVARHHVGEIPQVVGAKLVEHYVGADLLGLEVGPQRCGFVAQGQTKGVAERVRWVDGHHPQVNLGVALGQRPAQSG